ncbi:hypothetical protein T07_14133, partial [Trichinella nelsoni]
MDKSFVHPICPIPSATLLMMYTEHLFSWKKCQIMIAFKRVILIFLSVLSGDIIFQYIPLLPELLV